MMDLHADIVPGASAAGFSLGDDFHAVVAAISAFRRWQPGQGHLAAQLATNPGWLYVAPARDGQAATHGASLYFRNNCIRLGFNADTRRICRIEVGADYQGRLWGEVRVAFYGLEAGAGTMPNVEIQFIVVDGAALERD